MKAIELLKQERERIKNEQLKYLDNFEKEFADKIKTFASYPCKVEVKATGSISFDVKVLTEDNKVARYGQIQCFINREGNLISLNCVSYSLGRFETSDKNCLRQGALIYANLWSHYEDIEALAKTFDIPFEDEYENVDFEIMSLQSQEEKQEMERKIAEAVKNLRSHKYIMVEREARYGNQMLHMWYRIVKITEKTIVLVSIYHDGKGKEYDNVRKTYRKGEFIKEFEDARYLDEYDEK